MGSEQWGQFLTLYLAPSMALPSRLEYSGALHHVTARGNAQQLIFLLQTVAIRVRISPLRISTIQHDLENRRLTPAQAFTKCKVKN